MISRYVKFFQVALGVEPKALQEGFTRSTRGKYVERHGKKFVFLFTDIVNYGRVLAGHSQRLEKLGVANPEKVLKLKFDDLDYGFKSLKDFKPVATSLKIRRLTQKDARLLRVLRKSCSVKDWQTLDLSLPGDYALGVFVEDRLVGAARFARIKSVPKLVDITIVMAKRARGKGYSTPLVSELISKVIKKGFTIKYRVATSNVASRAIAKRLGLTPLFSLKTFS